MPPAGRPRKNGKAPEDGNSDIGIAIVDERSGEAEEAKEELRYVVDRMDEMIFWLKALAYLTSSSHLTFGDFISSIEKTYNKQ